MKNWFAFIVFFPVNSFLKEGVFLISFWIRIIIAFSKKDRKKSNHEGNAKAFVTIMNDIDNYNQDIYH